MALYGNAERVEGFGQLVRNQCLLQGLSMLTGDLLWVPEVFSELKRAYSDSPDETSAKFDDKVRNQLKDASSAAIQLFAELYIVDFAVLGNVGAETKISKIDALLQRCQPAMSLRGPDAPAGAGVVVDMFEHGGVLNGGQGYNTHRWRQMRYLINFGVAWSALDPNERSRRMADPVLLAETLETLVDDVEPQIVKALCYMLAPESFVPISSRAHLAQIVSHFADHIPTELATAPRQMQASAIRDQIRRERDSDWGFYDDPDEWQTRKKAPTAPRPTPSDLSQMDTVDDADVEFETLRELDESDATKLHVDHDWLMRLRQLLLRRRQVVFQGPPGTGKTYLARKIATRLTGTSDRVRLVQFHPAYTYEDFFEGFRPVQDGTLQLRPGPLRQLAEDALANPELSYVLVIDEMNRGNLARIFGELYFLLEYRDETVQLMYSQEPFTLPTNLFIIATMNTADRSIALVDSAMRRRFAFLDLTPDTQPTSDILNRWCTEHGVDPALNDLWRELNQRIRERDASAQIGPSYLMSPELTADSGLLETIWDSEIMPQLHESFYGNTEWVNNNLSLKAVRAATHKTTTAGADGAAAGDESRGDESA